MTLICPEHEPITCSISFVRGEYAAGAQAMLESRLQQYPKWSISHLSFNPCLFSRGLEPLNQSPTIFGETTSNWMYIVSQYSTTYRESLVEFFRSSSVYMEHQVSSRDTGTRHRTYRCDCFDYIQFQDLEVELIHRRLQVSEELSGKLYVASEGSLLEFEDERMSDKRFVRNNFSIDTICRYAETLGILFRDEHFYTGRAIKLALDSNEKGPKTFEEYRQLMGYPDLNVKT